MGQKKWMSYYIWGAGLLGERLTWQLPSEAVLGFIDSAAEKIGKEFCGKTIISFSDFKKNHKDCYIIVATYNYYPICDILKKNEIKRYYLMTDMPGDWSSPVYRPYLKNYIINDIKEHKRIAIVGCNPFSFLIAQWVYQYNKVEPVFFQDKDENAPYDQLRGDNLCFCDGITDGMEFDRIYYTTRSNEKENEYSDIMLNVWNSVERIREYHHPEISCVKNRYYGNRCFLIGNGPSLRMADLDRLFQNHELCFGVSEIYKAFTGTDWRPSFYVGGYEMMKKEQRKEVQKINADFVFLTDDSDQCEEIDSRDNTFRFHMHQSAYSEGLPPFSEDCTICCQHGGTIIYLCMQLAVYMGFRTLILLGVDFSHGKKGSRISYEHFYKEASGEDGSTCCETMVEKTYLSAKKYADSHGIKIYNATRGGMLEIFPRVNFDSLFNI